MAIEKDFIVKKGLISKSGDVNIFNGTLKIANTIVIANNGHVTSGAYKDSSNRTLTVRDEANNIVWGG